MRCLIVEDDTSLAELVQLEVGDYQVEGVCLHSIADALDSLKAAPPDALVLDLTLPDGCGLDVAAAAQRLCPQAPAMVFTGSDDADALDIFRRHHNVRAVVAKGDPRGDEVGAMVRSLISMIRAGAQGPGRRGLTLGGQKIVDAVSAHASASRGASLDQAAMQAALRKAAPTPRRPEDAVRPARPSASSEDRRKPPRLRA